MDMLDEIEQRNQRRISLAEKIWDRVISRKLLVWVFSSYAMMNRVIDVNTWLVITATFIGSEGAVNVVSAFKSKITK